MDRRAISGQDGPMQHVAELDKQQVHLGENLCSGPHVVEERLERFEATSHLSKREIGRAAVRKGLNADAKQEVEAVRVDLFGFLEANERPY